MPLLAAFIGNLFAGLVGWFAQYFTKKATLVAAGLASLTAAGLALVTAFNAIVKPLAQHMFTTQYGQFLGLAFPPVAGQCLTGLFLFWLACTTYRFQVQATKLTAAAV